MKIRNTLVICCLALSALSLQGRAADKIAKVQVKIDEPTIRVLIAKDVRGALIEARGPYKVMDTHRKELLSHGWQGKRFVMHALTNGLRWGEEYPEVFSVSIEPLSSDTIFYIDGMQYKGFIHVFSGKRGAVTVVNKVPIEDFVASTLALQINQTISKEALAAMSIAARTVAYSHVFHKENSALWDIAAQEVGYLGMGVTLGKTGIDEAIIETRHVVLEEGGAPLRSVPFSFDEAEKLASKGLNAKKILRNLAPQGEIGTNVSNKEGNKVAR